MKLSAETDETRWTPGRYQVRLRLFVSSDVNWPMWSRNPAEVATLAVNKIDR
jgi:hypothetical protein